MLNAGEPRTEGSSEGVNDRERLSWPTTMVKLKVQVSQTNVDRMVGWRAPSFVVGIDEPNQKRSACQ